MNESKVMIKTFIMLSNIYISDECCSSELTIHQIKHEKMILDCFQQQQQQQQQQNNIIIIIIIINVFLSKNPI